MAIELLDIQNFRNIAHTRLSPSPHLNVIVGKNGSGKTSLLESIYYLGAARSFRTPHSKHLIKIGEPQFNLYAKIRKLENSIGIGISRDPLGAKIKIANSIATNSSQLASLLAVQIINPDVHKMMEEGPRHRRRFMEWGVFHVKPYYFSDWQQCRRILKQRNAALKQGLSNQEISYWDEALAEIADVVTTVREDYLHNFQPHLDYYISRVPNLPEVTVKLDRGWSLQKSLHQALEDSRDSDRRKGFTHVGPHRADLQILVGKVRAKDIVSRGQQKMLAAIMKIAQIKYLAETEQGVDIVLLVDDLSAELDTEFRTILLSMVSELKVQIFLTATELGALDSDALNENSDSMFHVEQGSVDQSDSVDSYQ
ncbi:MAG: DNA replication/repair protein RecF [Gammaproteobacteria bacterium]|jgi:DNA replication and repair protein RecF